MNIDNAKETLDRLFDKGYYFYFVDDDNNVKFCYSNTWENEDFNKLVKLLRTLT